MKEVPISVTEAARNFADCVNRVRYQGASFLLEKNGVPVARIVPAEPAVSREAEATPTGTAGARVIASLNQDEMTPTQPASGTPLSPIAFRRVLLNW